MSTNAPLERERVSDRKSTESDQLAVSVDGLEKRYGSGESVVQAVDGVSFDIEPGTVVGLLGPNGAGKTTTIKTILGLVVPTAGTVTVGGVDVHDEPRAAYRKVGAMLEGARNVYWRLTVRENLEFFARLGGADPPSLRERHDQLLDQFGLAEKANETVNELSRGMKQKVSLACTLARETSVVFLDEPTLGLDVESSLELREELRRLAEQESITILLSSHDMDVVEGICDRVLIMNDGRLTADDSVENLLDLFRTHAYRVTIEGELPAATKRRLGEEFGASEWQRLGDRERFEVTLDSGTEFYAVMERLRQTERPLVSVSAIEPDLADVFLELTDESTGANQ